MLLAGLRTQSNFFWRAEALCAHYKSIIPLQGFTGFCARPTLAQALALVFGEMRRPDLGPSMRCGLLKVTAPLCKEEAVVAFWEECAMLQDKEASMLACAAAWHSPCARAAWLLWWGASWACWPGWQAEALHALRPRAQSLV